MKTDFLFLVFLVFGLAAGQQKPCPVGWTYRSHTDQCYLVSKNVLPYAEAVDFCKKNGGSLVSLKTSDEYDFVKDFYNNNSPGLFPPWIGLKHDSRWHYSVWRWPDGATAYYTKWLTNQPSSDDDNGACVAWRTAAQDGWKVLGCKYAQSYICKQHSANCPTSNFNKDEGKLSSSNYPDNYDNNLNCYYHIKVREGYKIKLEFTSFYTESFDKLYLYDDFQGHSENLIATLYGYGLYKKVYETTENVMTLNFKTDVSITKQGWTATYTAVPKEPTEIINKQKGTITSPNYPNNYNSNEDQLYLINALPDQIIKINVTDFETEKGYDYLLIEDGDDIVHSKHIDKLSGRDVKTPKVYYTTQNHALIRFFTDPSYNFRGFTLDFEAVDKY